MLCIHGDSSLQTSCGPCHSSLYLVCSLGSPLYAVGGEIFFDKKLLEVHGEEALGLRWENAMKRHFFDNGKFSIYFKPDKPFKSTPFRGMELELLAYTSSRYLIHCLTASAGSSVYVLAHLPMRALGRWNGPSANILSHLQSVQDDPSGNILSSMQIGQNVGR